MPLVSVVIPAYNGVSRYLEQAITSVLQQSFRDWELVVVDDASSDETAHLVAAYTQARYVRRQKNGGQATARNDGARLGTGIFLAFLDQDDLWEPTFLEEMKTALERHPDTAIIHSDGFQVNERNEVMEYDGAMKHRASITQLLRGDHDTATSGSLFRKTCFDTVGGYDERLFIWEDIDLAIRLYQRYPIVHLPKPLYRHRLYSRNVSRDIPSERALLGRRYFLDKHGASCKSGTREARALNRDWAHYYGDLGKHHLREGKIMEGRQAFWIAVKHDPYNHKAILRLLGSYIPHASM
ncbi:MAG: glycosyltransferase family 2 protein [Nitrospiraceae bacterium]